MEVYEKQITVSEHDLDELEHVNNVQYVQWIQDIAKEHWNKNVTDEIASSYFWVVVNHFIEYKSEAVLGDQILIKTFVTQSEGVTSTRHVEMYHEHTERLIVKAKTVWCLMDIVRKRPARIPDSIKTLFD